jgi:hypothetical protein
MATQQTAWPPLPLEDWVDTKRTLHRYCQVVGKIRMALVPFHNHWWHVTLQVDTRGVTTGPMPVGDGRTVEITFDFVDHRLVICASDGSSQSFRLAHGLACSAFYAQLFATLHSVGVNVDIHPAPFDLDGPLLSQDHRHDTYDANAVTRFWHVLSSSGHVLGEFAGWFNGKQSPVQLFWHSFDLALARFSGRRAPTQADMDRVTAEAYSHEVIAFGFWPGDDKKPYPAFYSYTAPPPDGLTSEPLRPRGAWWDTAARTAYLRYDDVCNSDAPHDRLLAFLTSAYEAGARLAGWDIDGFATSAAPGR